MPDLAKITAIESKFNAEAEPSPEGAPALSPDGAPSGAGSAPADGADGAPVAPDVSGTSPGATIDHETLRAKLEADRARRAQKARQRKIEEDHEAARKAREEAEAEKAKWSGIGKNKSFLETIKELGKDPLQTFEEMKAEALKAGTPEAKLEAMERAFDARMSAIQAELKAEREAREAERKASEEERRHAQQQAAHQSFVTDFTRDIRAPHFESLTDEYAPEQLFAMAARLKDSPDYFHEQAATLGVRLTRDDGRFTMVDILSVMKATQDRHHARLEEQRRKKNAAPQAAPGAAATAPVAKPTVNGTAERNAGTSLGNQLAATRAADPSPRKESKEERLRRLGDKYG